MAKQEDSVEDDKRNDDHYGNQKRQKQTEPNTFGTGAIVRHR